MKLGTTTDLLMNVCTDTAAIQEIAKLGFDTMDYGMFYHTTKDDVFAQDHFEDYAKQLRTTANDNGILFSQVHSPMFGYIDQDPNEDLLMELTLRSFRIAQILGAPYLVVHPRFFQECIYGRENQKIVDYNYSFYQKLIPYAKKHHVKIALENMFAYDPAVNKLCPTIFSTSKEMNEFIDGADDQDWFTVCLDTGHMNIIGLETPADAARTFGKRLELLHVHDNYGASDDHMPPYYGNIDWLDFMHALHEIGYAGSLSLEASMMTQNLPAELKPAGAKMMFDLVKKVATLA